VSHDLNVVRPRDALGAYRPGTAESVLTVQRGSDGIPHPPLRLTDGRRETWPPIAGRLYRRAVGQALALPIEDAWRPAVKANLEVSLRLARLVDEFRCW
jgi:hypothetical protein